MYLTPIVMFSLPGINIDAPFFEVLIAFRGVDSSE